ncbi:MAG: HIT domain-containing protein [Bacteroidetes bacterium]|nr:HIT domain-containing protein [Bacteroidota bacterium]
MASIFSKIIAGEIPCYKVAENEEFLAFLDIFPLKKGHTLVIPKKEVDYIFDLDSATYEGLMNFSARVARAIGRVIDCKRVGVSVIGLEVPHAHVHLIPIQGVHDMNFSNPKLQLTKEEFKAIAASIAAAFQ